MTWGSVSDRVTLERVELHDDCIVIVFIESLMVDYIVNHHQTIHFFPSRSRDQMVESESQWAAVQSGRRDQGEIREAGDSAVKKLPRDM